MLDRKKAINTLNSEADRLAKRNSERFKKGLDKTLRNGKLRCAHYVKVALASGGLPLKNSNIRSAKDYGPSLLASGFKQVENAAIIQTGGAFSIAGQQIGDVVVIQDILGHADGHMAMFNGTHWVSDFVQLHGFYPGPAYRAIKPAYVLYRYAEPATSVEESEGNIKICYPIPKQSGQEFPHIDDILAHLNGESTGLYLIGRNGMWHGGIHITDATTPWCALSGKAQSEGIDFPITYKGKHPIRCMADGHVVAYRICRDYLDIKWRGKALHFSGSFLLVRHRIQPGKTKESGLDFYTLYMHLAPYTAYHQDKKLWMVQDGLAAYKPEWILAAATNNEQETTNSYRAGTMPKGAIVEWDKTDTNLHITGFNQRDYGLVTFKGLSEENKNKGVKMTLTPGQQYWIVVDNNIVRKKDDALAPTWWQPLVSPSKDVIEFDKVVCPTPYPIKAGDAVGHLGYFQAAKESGYEARYQAHIECMSMDGNLENFLTNPEKVGDQSPLYLKTSPNIPLYKKEIKTGAFTKEERMTKRADILPLSQLTRETEKTSQQEYWYLRAENGYVPQGPKVPELLSQYDLAKLGFKTVTEPPPSFDYLTGKKQPEQGVVRSVFKSLLDAAKADTRTSHALVKFNYERLLRKIDSKQDNYSPMEYLRAFHNPDYHDVVEKMIVKHPSDWYHEKNDTLWLDFLNALKKEAPEWKKYSEAFLDKMVWMREVTTETLGPELWHMHPIRFLDALRLFGQLLKKKGWAQSKFAELLGRVESGNDYTAYNQILSKPYRTVAKFHTNLTSMTIKQVMETQIHTNIMFATGRFQIIPSTLKDAVNVLNLDKNTLYNEATQDRIFDEYLIKIKRKSIIDYLEGNGSVEDAAYAWAIEFASAGVRKGKKISKGRIAEIEGMSYYSGDGLNKAHIMPDEMIRSLEESKNGAK